MEVVRQIVLLLHLVGFAALFGGLLVQLRNRDPEINAAMLHGSYTALITGLVLAGFAEFGDDQVNHLKIGLKLLVALVVTVLVIINRRFTSIPRGLWAMLGLLTLANAAIAVLWQ
jgi:hypothetical protein